MILAAAAAAIYMFKYIEQHIACEIVLFSPSQLAILFFPFLAVVYVMIQQGKTCLYSHHICYLGVSKLFFVSPFSGYYLCIDIVDWWNTCSNPLFLGARSS